MRESTRTRFAPVDEFAVAIAARHHFRGKAKMQEAMDTMEIRDCIHTMAVYSLALQLAQGSSCCVIDPGAGC